MKRKKFISYMHLNLFLLEFFLFSIEIQKRNAFICWIFTVIKQIHSKTTFTVLRNIKQTRFRKKSPC